jgi:hypothetical protein
MKNPLTRLASNRNLSFTSFKYHHSGNLGDQVQSFAAEQYLPRIDFFTERDHLSTFQHNKKTILITNGWFAHSPETALPASDKILPVFFGFHLTKDKNAAERLLTPNAIEYLKRHAPIGCRDRGTQRLLESKGIQTFYSKCLTQTFPKRTKEPNVGKVMVVDAKYVPIPLKIRRKAEFITQICTDIYDNCAKREMARSLLEYYKENASLVITTRIHCAMPCVAMGIPVIYFGNPDDYRTALVKDLGLEVNRHVKSREFFYRKLLRLSPRLHSKLHDKSIKWTPRPLEIEDIKTEIKQSLYKKISSTISGSEYDFQTEPSTSKV